jgi:hypothetical protein
MDNDSIRVTGLGDAHLFDVICTPSSTSPTSAPHGTAERIRLLEAKKKKIQSERLVREHEADILIDYGKSLRGEHVSPENAASFLDGFVERANKNLIASAELEEAIVEIDSEIKKEKDRESKKKGLAYTEVTVVVVADRDGPVELKLTYSARHLTLVYHVYTHIVYLSSDQRPLGQYLRSLRHDRQHRKTLQPGFPQLSRTHLPNHG